MSTPKPRDADKRENDDRSKGQYGGLGGLGYGGGTDIEEAVSSPPPPSKEEEDAVGGTERGGKR